MKRLIAPVIVFTLSFAVAALAITYGFPDDDEHPYVGFMLFVDMNGDWWSCSGTLLSPTVFLTAGPCAAPAEDAWVTFEEELTSPVWVHGEAVAHPGYLAGGFPNTSDVGVVLLDEQVTDVGYAALPPTGYIDSLARRRGLQDSIFNIVGYGLQGVKPEYIDLLARWKAYPKLVNLGSALTDGWNIHLSSNPGKGGGVGGSCFGDSGGPAFYPRASNIVTGVGSFVLNYNCKGAGFYYRVDTDYAQDFIVGFLQ